MSRNLIIAVAAASVVAGAVSYAATGAENDAAAIANARVSLAAAVAAAEQHVQGKAVRAEYEQQKGGGWVFDVEVASGAKIFDVKVDADKGTIIASTEDKVDRADRDEDEED